MTSCPSCGSPLVDEPPPDAELATSPNVPSPSPSDAVSAARLGLYDRLAVPVLLDLLASRDIRAFEAEPLANPATRAADSVHAEVWVDSSRLEEAKTIASAELDAAIGDAAAELPTDQAYGEPVEPEAGEIEWTSFGWMETHVAIVFLEVCDEEAIPARTEYALDRPPPPWALPGMRVHVDVEDVFVADAEQLLGRVEERLAERGIEWTEPLCDLSGP